MSEWKYKRRLRSMIRFVRREQSGNKEGRCVVADEARKLRASVEPHYKLSRTRPEVATEENFIVSKPGNYCTWITEAGEVHCIHEILKALYYTALSPAPITSRLITTRNLRLESRS
ncbi:hypothetical protein E2C01_005666 [Portunus trituberculatus]|uniref:Uncharacterized protein n=1 Tax=Portunus trituberculatus TaxID=210409 RepID=A0A5B7CU38_PORTR|nr:hypothetical protein [Portunus trituberculatus]